MIGALLAMAGIFMIIAGVRGTHMDVLKVFHPGWNRT